MTAFLIVDTSFSPPCQPHGQRHLVGAGICTSDGILRDVTTAELLALRKQGDSFVVDLSVSPAERPHLMLKQCPCAGGYVLVCVTVRLPPRPSTEQTTLWMG